MYVLMKYPLNKAEIIKGFEGNKEQLSIQLLESVPSTNDVAKQLLRESPEAISLVATNRQTAGRGRHGKSFYSKLKHGLYLTIGITANTDQIENIPLYTILAAATFAETIEKHVEKPVQIKWVNDLFYNGKKVSGILSEMVSGIELSTSPGIVIGIGLNLAGDFEETDKNVQNVAGTLFGLDTPPSFNQNEFLSTFLNQFTKQHLLFHEKGFMKSYESHLMGIGKEVYYILNQQPKSGVIEGINEMGHLLVRQTDGSLEVLYGQEVHFGSEQFVK